MTTPQKALAKRAARATVRHARRGTAAKMRRRPLRSATLLGAGALLGLLAGWLLDPRRRGEHRARVDRRAHGVRRRAQRAGGRAAAAARRTRGAAMEATAPARHAVREAPDDRTLTDRVRSRVFRPDDAPKGDVVIDATEGVVHLRGTIGSERERDELVDEVAGVDGVRGVESLLHVRG